MRISLARSICATSTTWEPRRIPRSIRTSLCSAPNNSTKTRSTSSSWNSWSGRGFGLHQREDGNTLVRPFVLGSAVHLGEDILYASFGGGVEVSRQVNDGLGVTMRYDLRKKRFDDNASRPNASNEDGVEHSGQAYSGQSPSRRRSTRSRGHGSRVGDARVDYEANREYGGLVGLSVSYEPPLGNPSRRWLTSVSSEFSYVKHDAPYPAVSPTTRRADKKWDLRVQTNIPLTKQLSLGVGVTHSQVDSNLPNFKQNNTTVAVSVSRSF